MTKLLDKKLPFEELPNHKKVPLNLHLQVEDLAKTLMSTSKKTFNNSKSSLK